MGGPWATTNPALPLITAAPGGKFEQCDTRGPLACPAVITFAVFAGLATGALAVLAMLAIPFPTPEERRIALVAAFVDRTVLGFIVGPVARGLDVNGGLAGLVLGVGFSVGTALITRAYLPVIGLGALFGLAVGAAYEFVY